MVTVVLASETDFEGWRAAARDLRLAEVPPEAVAWCVESGAKPLFDDPPPQAKNGQSFTTSRAFLDLAQPVLLHRSAQRFDLLYRLLWRLRAEPQLIQIPSDPEVFEADRMRKSVRQAIHKMHAFVRFRRVEAEAEETYCAWFEPPHRVTLAAAEWFVRRMANVRFSILTPDIAVHWAEGVLSTSDGVERGLGTDQDELEAYWRAYYAAIFNPARLNPQLMAQHMPRRYWRNLPEASLIPRLVGDAQERTESMVQAQPTSPSHRAARIAARRSQVDSGAVAGEPETLEQIATAIQSCRRCPLWRGTTQAVPGEGPITAKLMLVGEQPGDQEDLAGHPFVGPAGVLLNRALVEAGLERGDLYVTNAVKHFKHELRGKRRLHKSPAANEIQVCRWWLDHERSLVQPKVIVALGASAARAVLGRPISIMKVRGEIGPLEDEAIGFVTVHPSYLLRIPDADAKAKAFDAFVQDLRAASKRLDGG